MAHTLRMEMIGNEIFVSFYHDGDLEYVVTVDKLVDFLEENDVSYVFRPLETENDPNPRFITGIPALDNSLKRIKKPS